MTLLTSGDAWMDSSLSFRDAIPLLFKKTTRSLILTAYAITSDYIVDELISVIQRQIPQIILYVYTGDLVPILPKIQKLREYDYDGSNLRIIEVTESLLHAKVIVVDNLYVICGSANLTKSAMTSNYEMGLMLKNSKIASQITQHLIKLR